MSCSPRSRMAPALALAASVAAWLSLLGGCSLLHRHGSGMVQCREPPVARAREMPPLKVPEGLQLPDSHQGVQVPPLTEPERTRGPREPCLSAPPDYGKSDTKER